MATITIGRVLNSSTDSVEAVVSGWPFLVNVEHDEVDITARTASGRVQTVVYKQAGATVATLTLSYDANDQLSGVTRA